MFIIQEGIIDYYFKRGLKMSERKKLHDEIVDDIRHFLKWASTKEYRFTGSEGSFVRIDLFAINEKFNVALVIEAKASSNNEAISGGIGQLLFYRELLSMQTAYNDMLFALAVPASKTMFKITKEGSVPLEEPSYGVKISSEAFNFAKRHNIGIFGVLPGEKVLLLEKFPLSLWLLIKGSESPT